MNRRTLLKSGGLAALSVMTIGAGPCTPSKEKAVRVAGFIIDIAKEALPLLDLLGAKDIAQLVRTKALPTLEKLKDALSNADIPAAGLTLTTVRNTLKTIGGALLNLPESPRRTTVIGILASINVLLLTVEAFTESETNDVTALRATAVGGKMLQVFEATRQ